MSEQLEPPLVLRGALAFGLPLREGLELVRGHDRGTTVVLGWDDGCEQVVEKGETVDQPATAEAILRATGGDGATILSPSLDRIVRKHTHLVPDQTIKADGLGTRHNWAQKYAKQTGWPVVAVSQERSTVTLFFRDSTYELRRLPELRTEINDIRTALRSTYDLMQADTLVSEAVRRSSLIEAEAKLAKLDGHLIELGSRGEDIRDDCLIIARLLGIVWEPTVAPQPTGRGIRGPADLDVGTRTRTTNDFSGIARNVVQAGSIDTVNMFSATVELPVPHQLPPAITPFADRVAVKDEVVNLLTAEDALARICVVVGGAGIGKSAFLARCGHDLEARFPDGVLHADLRGFHSAGRPVEPVDVLGGFLRDLGVTADAIPADLDGMVRLYRSRLHGRRMLIILDNARDADQVRSLLPGAKTCAVLTASRTAMTNLVVREGAHRIELRELPPADAVLLLAEITASPAVSLLAELAELCACNPLALRIAGVQARGYSPEELKDFVDDLRGERLELLSHPDDDDASVRAAFSLSYKALPADSRRAFRLLGLYPGATISTNAAEALIGDRRAIRRLGDAHLIEQIGPRRYRPHSLIRAYAAERALESEDPSDRRAALAGVLDWFRRNADTYGRALDRWHPRTEAIAGGATNRDQAIKWFNDELANFPAMAQAASEAGAHDMAWRFALDCSPYFFSRKPWATWISVQELGLAAARAANAQDGEAWLCDSLAVAYREQQRHPEAVQHLMLALELFEDTGNLLGAAQSNLHLAQTYRELDDLPRAMDAANASLASFREAGSAHGEARALNLLGGIEPSGGENAAALAHTERAMEIFDELADQHGYSWAVNNLGLVLAKLGRYEDAIAAFRAAMTARQRIDRYGLAFTHEGLGDVYQQMGQSAEARQNWRQALEIFEEVGDPRAERLRRRVEAHSDDHASAGPAEACRRLRGMSDGLAAELDKSSGTHRGSGEDHLSTGLYVPRTQQDEVLELLRPSSYLKPLLIHGGAGQGKSSLLWGLYQQLAAGTATEPYLLNSPWLAVGETHAPSISTAELRQAAEHAAAGSRVAVFLIDTVDLLLHDDLHVKELLDLCDTLTASGAEVVLTSRPEEAERLPKPSFRRVGLGSYDDVELPLAVASHVAAFCPRALPGSLDEKIKLIVGAVARGLAVREVVQSPLTLRLSFELYAPEFPSLEHDVSSLYQAYWRRRIETDQRSEEEPGDGRNLSASVGHLAIALLAAGRIERNEQLLLQSATAVAAAATSSTHTDALAAVKTDTDELVSRGVLIRTERGIRFFHQTMFEYAAALALLIRDGARALDFLRDHLNTHQDDLFVGAVVEQMLIMALDHDHLAGDAARIIKEMAEAGGSTLPRIALAALAHRPGLAVTIEQLLDTVSLAAVRRYVQTMPTVANADLGLQVTMLGKAWHRGEAVHESVLESLERLASRDAAGVQATVIELGCVDTALGRNGDPAKVIQLVARVVVAAAGADPAWARQQLLNLFDDMIQRNTHRTIPLHLIELIADNWAVLGSADAASDIRARIVEAQGIRDAGAGEMRKTLGHIEALAWRDEFTAHAQSDDWWWTAVEDLCTQLEHDFYDVLANARLVAVAELIVTGVLGPERAVRTIIRLAELTGSAPFSLNRGLYAPLFAAYDEADDNPVTPVVPLLLSHLDGLPAPGNKPMEGPPRWAHVTRQALHDSGLAAGRVATLLADVPAAAHRDSWLLDEQLVVLLVPAAVGGHPVAAAALDHVWAQPDQLSPIGQKNVSYDLVRQLPDRPALLRLLVELSIHRMSSTPLSEVLISLDDALLTELRRASARLSTLLDQLFAGGAGTKEAVSLWRRLYHAGAVQVSDLAALRERFHTCSDPAARGNILSLAADAALARALDHHAVDAMLRSLFRVNAENRTITSPNGSEAGHVARAARGVWLRLVCTGCPIDAVDVDEVLIIATAAPATADNLTVLGRLITRFAEQGSPATATRVLLRVTEAVAALGFSRKQENGVANKLRTPIRTIFRHTVLADQRALLALAPTLPRTHARILVAAAAQENFYLLRPDLAALLANELPEGVAEQVQDDMTVRSRTEAVGTILRLLRPLTDSQDA